mmetsp:Transcript_11473/g.21538  ORF Transcript_11473/g.21538 Transcript_11473/m.21538 type:complete len:1396 (-) Transcript_11473:111-4298(-)
MRSRPGSRSGSKQVARASKFFSQPAPGAFFNEDDDEDDGGVLPRMLGDSRISRTNLSSKANLKAGGSQSVRPTLNEAFALPLPMAQRHSAVESPGSRMREESSEPPDSPRSTGNHLSPKSISDSRRQTHRSSERKQVQIDSALKVLSEHPLFEGMRLGAISNIARVAHHKVIDGNSMQAEADEQQDHKHDGRILTEGDRTNEALWVIEHGAVVVEEGGEVLGTLKEDTAFGASVSIGLVDSQLFTVRPAPEELEGTLSVWQVPNRAVQTTLNQYPEAKKILEERVDLQVKELLGHRVSRLLFFSHCTQGLFQNLYSKMTVEHFARGSQIFLGGEHADSMLMIVCGTIRMGNPVKANMMRSNTIHHNSPGKLVRSKTLTAADVQRKTGRDSMEPFGRALPAKGRGSQEPGGQRSTPRRSKTSNSLLLVGPKASPDLFLDRRPVVPHAEDDANPDQYSEAGSQGSLDGDMDNDRRRSHAEEDTDDSSSVNSSDSEVCFLPKGSMACHTKKLIPIGKEAIIFGEGVLLGYQNHRLRPVIAAKDTVALRLYKDDFTDIVERYPRERRQFDEMAAAHYHEWKRSDISRLASVDIFSRCSESFLLQISQVATLQLFFAGENIIHQGLVPRGLLLLMSGVAEEESEDGTVTPVQSPQSFGTLEWLGVRVTAEQHDITAKELCLVFNLSREHLLEALKDHANESTVMVQQVMRHNGMRLSITSGLEALAAIHKRKRQSECKFARPGMLNVWHMPFCRDCDANFLTMFTLELKICKLVPGQMVFSAEPGKTRKGEDADFLLILICGSVQVDRSSQMRQGDLEQVQAPLVITGFNRKYRSAIVTATVCEVHRLSVPSCQRLAEKWPKDTKRVLQRMIEFQRRREEKTGTEPWWNPTTSLRHQAWFKDSDEEFLNSLSQKLTTAVYLPGEVIVNEGEVADSTMLLECGTIYIERVDTRTLVHTDHIGQVHDGYWIGEMAMFAGESRRRATITASTVCKVHKLMNKALVELLLTFPTERQRFRELAEHRLRAVEKERLEDHDFFKDFDREFLNRLRQKCRPQVFFAQEVLMKQGEIADCLFILGSECIVSLEVDEVQVKRIVGRACLGTKALLSARPVKRASTVITQTVCAVRTLTRDDWLDSLKLYPQQLKWLKAFTEYQIGKVENARNAFMKKRAWEKIQQREAHAAGLHRERLAQAEIMDQPWSFELQMHLDSPGDAPAGSETSPGVEPQSEGDIHALCDTPQLSGVMPLKSDGRCGTALHLLRISQPCEDEAARKSLAPRYSMASRQSMASRSTVTSGSGSPRLALGDGSPRLTVSNAPRLTVNGGPRLTAMQLRSLPLHPESWDCFNGSKTTVPQLRLPMLQTATDAADSPMPERQQSNRSDSCDSLAYTECEEALGIAAGI